MHAANHRPTFCSFWQQKLRKNYTFAIILIKLIKTQLLVCHADTSHMRHGRGLIKNLSMKSDFSQTRPSRSGFDSEREAFRALILNEIKQVGFIWLIGCVIMNALIVSWKLPTNYGHSRTGILNSVYFGPQTAKNRTGVLTHPPAIFRGLALTSQKHSIGAAPASDPPNGWPSRWAFPRFLVDNPFS